MTLLLQQRVKLKTRKQSGEILSHRVNVTVIINYTRDIACPKRVTVQYLVIRCINLRNTQLANGHVVAYGSLLGNTTEYRCNKGYELIGDTRRKCQQDETWTGAEPTCRSKQERYIKKLVTMASFVYFSQDVQHSLSSKEWISLTSQLQ